MRRRDRTPDKRLNWRDPNMPVLRYMEFGWGEKRLVEVPPHEEQEYCASAIDLKAEPNWKKDPSYAWARPDARRRRL
jgi:hypothetical protein